MRRLALSLICISAVFLPTAIVQADDQQELIQFLEDFIEEEDIAGGIVLIRDGKEELVATAGLANRETGEPITADTRFYAASVGKMMVAAAILSAVDEGLISLQDPIDPFLATLTSGDRLDRQGPVKLSQLLNHTSGLAEYLNHDFLDASDAFPDRRWTAEQALRFADGEPAERANQRFEYTNTNYVILGHILEQLDGSLEVALTQRVFSRAGMGATSVGFNPGTMAPFARGYDQDSLDVSSLGWNSILGDGPVMTTADDLASFMQALFQEQAVLSQRMLTQMQTPSLLQQNYGLGLGLYSEDGETWVGHDGGYEGFEASVSHNIETGLTVVFMINGNMSSSRSVLRELAEWYLD